MELQNHDEGQEQQTERAKAEIRHPVITRVRIFLSLALAFALFDLFVYPPMPVILAEIVVTGYCALHPEIILNAQLLNPDNWKGEDYGR
jgi:hypothetical protein